MKGRSRPDRKQAANQVMSESATSGTEGDSGTSTLASGPAGTHFEAQVAASYFLAMVCGAPPRGLPGTAIDRIGLQQANAGRALDDVIIYAHDFTSGKPAVLEIQVKRSITFAPTDAVFRKVVGQIVRTAGRPDFWTQRYELAIATTKGSRRIDGAYQDTLTLARQVGDAATFFAQIKLTGAANDDMRAFVNTFRSHLQDERARHDDEIVWQLLRRLQILTFDFTAPGSASIELAIERSVRALHSDDGSRAGALWASLIELCIDVAKSGGDRDRQTTLQLLSPQGYRFAGERRHTTARAALAEASRLALADIRNHVGKVVLSRHERVGAALDALDSARYVEIRGDAGVGKSGVLRHLAEAMQSEGQVIVLSPGRCTPRGWIAMRSQLGFDGTLRELLSELANDGGATVFVDNLDGFGADERSTVVDIVGEASKVPGVKVVATARQEFGVDEPNWLPSEALWRLGHSCAIAVNELTKAEIEQLTTLDPSLAPLLTDGHPARQVTRNLFRLARLAAQTASEPVPHTEVDMAEQWWLTADGVRDGGWRERSRLLQDMAGQSLSGADSLDVKAFATPPIEALVASGTLRSLAADRVAFRHDVFREWAIANSLHVNSHLLARLPMDRPAPTLLARGVELAARMAVERATDGVSWRTFLIQLSAPGVHRSWRRAVLLALARSEAGEHTLQRAAPQLLADGAALLRELLRTVMAVDVIPATTAFAATGIDASLIPSSLSVPRGPSWSNLIVWLLSLGDAIPGEAVPEVVQLYTEFSVGTLGVTDITPFTTKQIYRWLRQMEPSDDMPDPSDGTAFWTQLDREGIQSLRSDLRSSFVMFAGTVPELAASYLQAVTASRHNENIARSLLKMRGTLARAAPAELAELTVQALISKPRRRTRHFDDSRDEAFTYLDHEFLQGSPSQGPFLELLTSSPQHGLALVHRLVAHAVSHGSRGAAPGAGSLTLELPSGNRTFPWPETYLWSRRSNYYAVTCALMALESWAHRRIDAGHAMEEVVADVLGPVGSCAAYVLVAVDLILSHWPKSLDASAAFLGCPELLCVDHSRQVDEQVGILDPFGLGALGDDPQKNAAAEKLRKRPSRRRTLDQLIGSFMFTASPEQQARLKALLEEAAARLGMPEADANFGDPEFMVQYALNLVEPSNWQEVKVTLNDGSTTMAHQYVAPTKEREHLQALRDAAAGGTSDFEMQSALSIAVDDSSRVSPESRQAAIAWARLASTTSDTSVMADAASQRMQSEAILTAAMLLMRDSDEAQSVEHGDWARARLDDALSSIEDDPAYQMRSGLRFNPPSIAYAVLIYALRFQHTPDDVRALLSVAANGKHAVAHGFGAAIEQLGAVDTRFPRSVLRCALSSCIAEHRIWDATQEETDARAARRLHRATGAIEAEMGWLFAGDTEPRWPIFPDPNVQPRRHLRLLNPPEPQSEPSIEPELGPTTYANHQAGALWLRQIRSLTDSEARPWLDEFVRAYMPWTLAANGGALAEGDETDDRPSEWNHPFFSAVARCTSGLTPSEVDDLVVRHIVRLPDQNYYDVLADFLRSLDAVYFGGGDISTEAAVGVRKAFIERMLTTRGWDRLSRSRDLSVEMHLGPAIAVLFFNDHDLVAGSKCYLLERGIERVAPFLDSLEKLVQTGPSPFVALLLLNLLEVAPRPEHLRLLVSAAAAWLDAYPDFRQFWLDLGVGRRWCLLIDALRSSNPADMSSVSPLRATIDALVAALVALGVPQATRLEEELGKL